MKERPLKAHIAPFKVLLIFLVLCIVAVRVIGDVIGDAPSYIDMGSLV